jgi:hypothetical protein
MASHGGGGVSGISVYSTDDMQEFVRAYAKWFSDASVDMANLAPALNRRILLKMRHEGVEGRLGISARTAARRIVNPIAAAAEQADHAARGIILAGRRWETDLVEPVREARRQQQGQDALRI